MQSESTNSFNWNDQQIQVNGELVDGYPVAWTPYKFWDTYISSNEIYAFNVTKIIARIDKKFAGTIIKDIRLEVTYPYNSVSDPLLHGDLLPVDNSVDPTTEEQTDRVTAIWDTDTYGLGGENGWWMFYMYQLAFENNWAGVEEGSPIEVQCRIRYERKHPDQSDFSEHYQDIFIVGEFEDCVQLGDVNGDGGWNVLDVVMLSNCILDNNCISLANGCAGDTNADGGWNVLDVVQLSNCILDNNCSGL